MSTRLHLGEEGTSVRIAVCDEGEGFNGLDPEKLFEPFFTTHAKGTGLGLAICRQIIEQHGGSVVLEAGIKVGTCAIVILPTIPKGNVASAGSE